MGMGLNRSNNRGSEWDRMIWGLFAKKIGGIMIGDGWKLWTKMRVSLYFSNSKLHGRLSPVDDGECRGSSGTFFFISLKFIQKVVDGYHRDDLLIRSGRLAFESLWGHKKERNVSSNPRTRRFWLFLGPPITSQGNHRKSKLHSHQSESIPAYPRWKSYLWFLSFLVSRPRAGPEAESKVRQPENRAWTTCFGVSCRSWWSKFQDPWNEKLAVLIWMGDKDGITNNMNSPISICFLFGVQPPTSLWYQPVFVRLMIFIDVKIVILQSNPVKGPCHIF